MLIGIHGCALAAQNLCPKWLFAYVLEPVELQPAEKGLRLGQLVACYLIVGVLFRMLAWHACYRVFVGLRENIIRILRQEMFFQFTARPLAVHSTLGAGCVHSLFMGHPMKTLSETGQHLVMSLPAGLVSVIFTFAFLFAWDWPIAITTLACASASVLITARTSASLQASERAYQSSESRLSNNLEDCIRGIRTLKLMRLENRIESRLAQGFSNVADEAFRRDMAMHRGYMRHEVFGYLCFVCVLVVCAIRYGPGHADAGIIAACLMAYTGLAWPLHSLVTASMYWSKAKSAAATLDGLLEPALSRASGHADSGRIDFSPPSPTLVLKDVAFGFRKSERLFSGIDIEVNHGDALAIVGPSGCGKTTLLHVISGFYEAAAGKVSIGGFDVRELPSQVLRELFSIVPQDPFFFNATVRENITLCREDVSDEDIEQALRDAEAWDFVCSFPDGMDTLVGTSGATLSGGQRQRLAIARALLSQSKILILDEATNALDSDAEQKIISRLLSRSPARTILCVSHNPDVSGRFQRILDLESGSLRRPMAAPCLA